MIVLFIFIAQQLPVYLIHIHIAMRLAMISLMSTSSWVYLLGTAAYWIDIQSSKINPIK